MLKKMIIGAAAVLCATVAVAANNGAWKNVNASELRIVNKGFADTQRDYDRLPAYLQDSIRAAVWSLQQNSAGIGVRFATNSSRIGVRYRLLNNNTMPHMADTGTKGTDLYILKDGKTWRHAGTVKPTLADKANRIVDGTYIANLDTTRMAEYIVNFPLYDGVEWLEIKVDSGAIITPGSPDIIGNNGKIVAYGTSIMQGGCATRPGMTSTNIISRELNREVVNLGFSGNGKMDLCIARAMAQIPDVALYLVDPVPNCSKEEVDSLTTQFIGILHDAHPDVPVVMVEGPQYAATDFDSRIRELVPTRNAIWREKYEQMKKQKYNIYYIDNVNLTGSDELDGTVDGTHLTDLGYRWYVKKVMPVLKKALKKK